MKSVIFKQERAVKGKILTAIVLVFSLYFFFFRSEPFLERLLFFVITLLIYGFSTSYKINSDFRNQKLYSVFGITVFSTKLTLDFPEYISVFSATFSLDNGWGPVSALGTQERHDRIVVRFFKGNKNFTLFKTKDYQTALEKASALSELLDVEIYNAIDK